MKPIAVAVVRGGCAELYCTNNVQAYNIDIDNIKAGDPKVRMPRTETLASLVRIAGIEKYVKWIPEVK